MQDLTEYLRPPPSESEVYRIADKDWSRVRDARETWIKRAMEEPSMVASTVITRLRAFELERCGRGIDPRSPDFYKTWR